MATQSVASGITLTADDINDFNSALSMAWVGSFCEDPGASGDSGEHLKNICECITHHLCRIRNRHTAETEPLLRKA